MYLLVALIIISVVVTATIANRWSFPVIIIALGVGIVFGSDVTGLIYFDNAVLARRVADFALAFILFQGGFGTHRESMALVFQPSMLLATVGVLVSAGVTTAILHFVVGMDFRFSLLIGAIISSTDAAATFSILRGRSLDRRTAATLEIESAANDPMAIVLTTVIIGFIGTKTASPLAILGNFAWQLVLGVGIGLLCGRVMVWLFNRIQTGDRGFLYVLSIAAVLLPFGLATTVGVSGALAVFFAGFVMGNERFVYKRGIATFLDALSSIMNIGLFVLLGLLCFPHEFSSIWKQGVAVFLVLTLVARPVAVLVSTAFSRFTARQRMMLAWSGVRGAVPIVLATYPAVAGISGSREVFNVVFFAVGLSIILQGSTIGTLADRLGLAGKAKPVSRHALELVTMSRSDFDVFEVHIDADVAAGLRSGARPVLVSSLALPPGTVITMIDRKDTVVAPTGSTELLPGDTLFILCEAARIDEVSSGILARFMPHGGMAENAAG